MNRTAFATSLVVVCIAATGVAIALASDSSDDGGQVPRSQDGHSQGSSDGGPLSADVLQRVKADCPPQLTGEADTSQCSLVFLADDGNSCDDSGPGGSDLTVSGISCELGRALRTPFSGVFTDFDREQDVTYRPTLATGQWPNLTPTEMTGWTCRASFVGGRSSYSCWHGSDWLRFEQG